MDPLTLIWTAMVSGAAAAAGKVAGKAIVDSYNGLKTMIVGAAGKAAAAIESLEARPDSENRQGTLKEELEDAKIDQNQQVLAQAQSLLKMLEGHEQGGGDNYRAVLKGSGAIAQGKGAKAVGAGGVMIGGNVGGKVTTRGASVEGEDEEK